MYVHYALFTTDKRDLSALENNDLTWTTKCKVARRGAGRSIAAGQRAPNTKVDQGPEKQSLASSHPKTKKKEKVKTPKRPNYI